MLNREEKIRYQRQLLLPNFGEEAQEKLKNAKVVVAGAGGLGGPLCYYLAAAGVGHLIIADCDQVELSNLNRQILHSTKKIGLGKAKSAEKTLLELNPEIKLEAQHVFIDDDSILLAKGADVLIDCLDNIKARQVLNRFSQKENIPIVHAGIDGWHGQLTLLLPGETACINCLFNEAVDSKEEKPVLGALVGVVGTMQALETIKFLINGNSELKNTLLYFDGVNLEWTKIPIQQNKSCKVCGNTNQ